MVWDTVVALIAVAIVVVVFWKLPDDEEWEDGPQAPGGTTGTGASAGKETETKPAEAQKPAEEPKPAEELKAAEAQKPAEEPKPAEAQQPAEEPKPAEAKETPAGGGA